MFFEQFDTFRGEAMTEVDKAVVRRRILSLIGALFVVLAGYVLVLMNRPMEPIVVEFGDRAIVRWGDRFAPFLYMAIDDNAGFAERLVVPGVPTFYIEDGHILQESASRTGGTIPLTELPPEASRRFFEGRIILDEYRKKSSDAKASDEPRVTSP